MLHDGLLAGSELPEVAPDLTGDAFAELARQQLLQALGRRRQRSRRHREASRGARGDLEVVFLPSPALHDGRFANDGWLQELPDPLTKLTWDNPALVSPKTAQTLGLAGEELVRLDYAGRSLDLPLWILPGMADGVVALTLGYGRVARGTDRVRSRVRHLHGPSLQGTWLRRRRHTQQARTRVHPFGDAEPRQHGGAPPRPRVHADGASNGTGLPGPRKPRARVRASPHDRRKVEKPPAHPASSRRRRNTSHSGRNTPTIRGTSGG